MRRTELGETRSIARLEWRSESDAHEPEPGARVTPAFGARLPSTPETMRVPPVALTLNVFAALEKKSELVVSAHTNEPE